MFRCREAVVKVELAVIGKSGLTLYTILFIIFPSKYGCNVAHGQKMSVCLIFLHIKWGE